MHGRKSTLAFSFLATKASWERPERERRRRVKPPKTQSRMPPPLFDVPGWSVSTEPAPSKRSKKRKRPNDSNASSDKLESAQVNLDKLMGTLDRVDPVKRPPKKRHKGKKSTDTPEGVADNKPTASTPLKDSLEKVKMADMKKPSKRTHQLPKEKGNHTPQHPTKVADPGLTTLQNRMKKKLDGARFR
jgi:ribosomal RNA-processing protein 8